MDQFVGTYDIFNDNVPSAPVGYPELPYDSTQSMLTKFNSELFFEVYHSNSIKVTYQQIKNILQGEISLDIAEAYISLIKKSRSHNSLIVITQLSELKHWARIYYTTSNPQSKVLFTYFCCIRQTYIPIIIYRNKMFILGNDIDKDKEAQYIALNLCIMEELAKTIKCGILCNGIHNLDYIEEEFEIHISYVGSSNTMNENRLFFCVIAEKLTRSVGFQRDLTEYLTNLKLNLTNLSYFLTKLCYEVFYQSILDV